MRLIRKRQNNDIYVSYYLHRGRPNAFCLSKWLVVPFKYYRGYVYDESNFPSFFFKRNALKAMEMMNEAAKWGLQEGRMEESVCRN